MWSHSELLLRSSTSVVHFRHVRCDIKKNIVRSARDWHSIYSVSIYCMLQNSSKWLSYKIQPLTIGWLGDRVNVTIMLYFSMFNACVSSNDL